MTTATPRRLNSDLVQVSQNRVFGLQDVEYTQGWRFAAFCTGLMPQVIDWLFTGMFETVLGVAGAALYAEPQHAASRDTQRGVDVLLVLARRADLL